MTTDKALTELARIQNCRTANRDSRGRIDNHAYDLRLQAEERRIVIAALGMEPEKTGETYAAETGELIADLKNRA